MSEVVKLMNQATLTALEARVLTEHNSKKQKLLESQLVRCHLAIKSSALRGEDNVKVSNIPNFIVEDLSKALEQIGYEVGAHEDGENETEDISYLWITW